MDLQATRDHSELLNAIDELRSKGVSQYVDLPQIIVGGDQSAGKSSVLEAISRVPFPVKETLCTRVATELVLRRSSVTRIDISIVPSADRMESEKNRLRDWTASDLKVTDLPEILDQAMKEMGVKEASNSFGKDVLRVEILGPDQPHLTLVDLPGLFHAGTKEQSEHEAGIVKDLVLSYMKNPRSIILAVVSASNDVNNQIILTHARQIDPEGLRTMGVITKPDCLPAGSASEDKYIQLAGNKDVSFRLGWHVLKNRDYEHRHLSPTERDHAEQEFFIKGVWNSLPKTKLGAAALKRRLSDILKNQILTHLPSLVADVQSGITESNETLAKLGDPRTTIREERSYLLRLSEQFTTIMRNSLDGRYDHPYFGNASSATSHGRRLRAIVQNLLTGFSDQIRLNGCYKPPGNESAYVHHVRQMMQFTRGRELPGTFNPQIIGDLFLEQSKPWQGIATRYVNDIFEATKKCVLGALKYLTKGETFIKIIRQIIRPAIRDIEKQLQGSMETVLEPYTRGHPITYNHYLTENIQSNRQKRHMKGLVKKLREYFQKETINNEITLEASTTINLDKMASRLTESTEADMQQFAAMEAIDTTDAYYKVRSPPNVRLLPPLISTKVSMKTFIDQFSVLSVENTLQKITEIFSVTVVGELEDHIIRQIAAENDETIQERSQAIEKKDALIKTLETLNRLDSGQSTLTKKRSRDENIESKDDHLNSKNGVADKFSGSKEDAHKSKRPATIVSSSDCELVGERRVATTTPQQSSGAASSTPSFNFNGVSSGSVFGGVPAFAPSFAQPPFKAKPSQNQRG
ncbi:MAG: hypothetical protein Q9227_000588 [Pyrenula ochraceoflavens]